MTTSRFKDFGSGGDVNTQPLSFKLYGEDFQCKTALQGKVLYPSTAWPFSSLLGAFIPHFTTHKTLFFFSSL
jgi:hypothetical protein